MCRYTSIIHTNYIVSKLGINMVVDWDFFSNFVNIINLDSRR